MSERERPISFSRELWVQAREDAYTAFDKDWREVLSSVGSDEFAAAYGSWRLFSERTYLISHQAAINKLKALGRPTDIRIERALRTAEGDVARQETSINSGRTSYKYLYGSVENPYERTMRNFENTLGGLVKVEVDLISFPYTWAFGSNFRGVVANESIRGKANLPTREEISALAMRRVVHKVGNKIKEGVKQSQRSGR